MSSSCRKIFDDPGDCPIEQVDSSYIDIHLLGADFPVHKVDVFFFETSGLEALSAHCAYNLIPDDFSVLVPEGDKKVVVVLNSPREFNLAAMSKYSSVSLVTYNFRDDSPDYPIATGQGLSEGGSVRLELRCLLSRVVLSEITCGLDHYDVLEEPRIRLRNINSSAGAFQTEGFQPVETIDAGEWTALPYDVGLFTQTLGLPLYCYPNECDTNDPASQPTQMELECTIRGELCSFTLDLPPIARGDSLSVNICVDGPDDFTYKVVKN